MSVLFVSLGAYAQERQVRGTISDYSTGETLPGASVLVKGTTNGVTTDIDGKFALSIPDGATLVVSFIGYETEEIIVGSRSVIDIALMPDIQSLNEVVVVGYGSVEKKDVTGVVSKVDAKNFNKGVINAPDKLLDGKVAGLQITSNGDPGGGTSIRLRGVSINGEFPLIVIDGVPLDGGGGGVAGGRNPLNFMNPSDVLDITVLKDASAAAIYGARGANGVIIITTKSGTTGKPRVSYDGGYSASILTRRPDFLDAAQYRAAINLKAPQELNDLGDANTDWIKEVTQVANTMQHNISLSGGFANTKTNYHASVNYLKNEGVMRFTENEKLNLSLKLNQKLFNDKLSITVNSKNGFTWDLFGPNVIGSASAFDPTRPVLDPDNTLRGGYFQWDDALATPNPVATQELTDNQGNTFRNISNADLEYKVPFIDGLSLKANLAIDYNRGYYKGIAYPEAKESLANGGSGTTTDEVRFNQLYEYYGNYKKKVGVHNFDITAGYAWQNFTLERDSEFGDSLRQVNGTWQPTYNVRQDSFDLENRLISFFARLNYDYQGKYLLTASIRRDGSSKFGESNRWGLFPAVALGWRVLEEDFAEGLKSVFNELKVRGSYGITGNEQIGNYLYATYYRYSIAGASYQFGDEYVRTIRPTGVDPNIKWEETASLNIGIDAGFFAGRLNTSIEYYQKDVYDLLYNIAVPAGSNLSDRVTTNIGQVRNSGFELNLDAVAYDRTDFRWDLSYNVSYNKNEVIKLDNLEGENLRDFPGYPTGGISGDIGNTIQILRVGEPINAFYTYKHKRNADGSPVTDVNGDGIQSLLEMYEDINEDGTINENDLVVNEKPFPNFLMGLTSNMSYKNWDLAMTFKASLGNYVYNNVASANGYFERLTDRVTNNIHQSAFETNFNRRNLFSDYYVENASFVRLDNISLGYNFQNVSFAKIRAYTTVQNVFTLTGYSGVDPEIFGGIDNNLYPRSITFTLGVNATF
ncbi:SusC/RagA family TonB-linked outer membrane protein [Shiella aurantiaca]|nr:TonB-dependent receptor [Shiella aurantiaca]